MFNKGILRFFCSRKSSYYQIHFKGNKARAAILLINTTISNWARSWPRFSHPPFSKQILNVSFYVCSCISFSLSRRLSPRPFPSNVHPLLISPLSINAKTIVVSWDSVIFVIIIIIIIIIIYLHKWRMFSVC